MKVIKGLLLFCFFSLVISACFDAPEFSNTPELSFRKIVFKEVPGVNTNDSLILYLDFRDGDGDLGVDQDELDEPFNESFYFIADGLGDTTKIGTVEVFDVEDRPYTLLKSEGMTGKLVTDRTRSLPGYGYLPPYDESNDCDLNYSQSRLLVPAAQADATYEIKDTLYSNGDMYFLIQGDPLLFKLNPNYGNIDVKFWVFENGTFVEYNWLEEACFRFDARFPILAPGKRGPLEGTIRYAMLQTSFLATFSIKTLKLSVRIKDRALNQSEEIFTPTFTLDGIRN